MAAIKYKVELTEAERSRLGRRQGVRTVPADDESYQSAGVQSSLVQRRARRAHVARHR